MKYGNDLKLSDLTRSLTNYMADLNALLRDGHLESASLVVKNMKERVKRLKERLDEIICGSR
jgi:predicted translin family RNA/ssDNA-binding protein